MDASFEASRVQREQALFVPTPLIELSAPAINIEIIFRKGDKGK